jgi:hypothetical protein
VGIVPLLERWNGTAWTQSNSPSLPPGTSGEITALTAISPGNAWAVGGTSTAAGTQTLTEHWNGTSWTIVPAINPGSDSDVTAVDATSASNAWAVGQAGEGLDARSLIEHWNRHLLDQVAQPEPGSERRVPGDCRYLLHQRLGGR